jgi:hypothetical protein
VLDSERTDTVKLPKNYVENFKVNPEIELSEMKSVKKNVKKEELNE